MRDSLRAEKASPGTLLFMLAVLWFVCSKNFLPIYTLIMEGKSVSFSGWMYVTDSPIIAGIMILAALGTALRLRIFRYLLFGILLVDGVYPAYAGVAPIVNDQYMGGGAWWMDRAVMAPIENLFMDLGLAAFLKTSIVRDWVNPLNSGALPESMKEFGMVRNRKWGNAGMFLTAMALVVQALLGWKYDPVLTLKFSGDPLIPWYVKSHVTFALLYAAFCVGIASGGKARQGWFGKALAAVAVLLLVEAVLALLKPVGWPDMLVWLPWTTTYSAIVLMSLAFLHTEGADKAFRWRTEQR